MIQDFDLVIIGGGINGAGIARDAAGRGMRVLLVEKGDLAAGTSSVSTGIIHGGIRYLEKYEFNLVRHALREREVLMGIAPHLVYPMTFVMPDDNKVRSPLLIKAGMILYDSLARRDRLDKSHRLDLQNSPFGEPLHERFKKGFTYSDCRTSDARLVVMNAMDAQMRGATILTRTECTDAHEHDKRWHLTLKDKNATFTVTAAAVVNAGGPWVLDIINKSHQNKQGVPGIRLIQGSHILVPKLYEGDQAYTLQQPDRRIVFAIPAGDYTQIGTTDNDNYKGDLNNVQITDGDISYLCEAANRAFKHSITRADVVWSYSGVRPQAEDGKKDAASVSRDYVLHLHENTSVPMISVYGGKLTVYRVVSEQVVDILQREMGREGEPWTAGEVLPGGDIPHGDYQLFLTKKKVQYPWLPDELLQRYGRAYGTWMDRFLDGARSVKDLGKDFGHGLYEAEARYMIQHEFAQTSEDILWRRSKLGMKLDEKQVERLDKELPYMLHKGFA